MDASQLGPVVTGNVAAGSDAQTIGENVIPASDPAIVSPATTAANAGQSAPVSPRTSLTNDRGAPLPAAVGVLRRAAEEEGRVSAKTRTRRAASGIFSRIFGAGGKATTGTSRHASRDESIQSSTLGISSANYFKHEPHHSLDRDFDAGTTDSIRTTIEQPVHGSADAESSAAFNTDRTLRSVAVGEAGGATATATATAVQSTVDYFVDADAAGDTVKRVDSTEASTVVDSLAIDDDNRPAPLPHVASIFAPAHTTTPEQPGAASRTSSISGDASRNSHRRSVSQSHSRKSGSNDTAGMTDSPTTGQDGKSVRRIRSLWRLFHRSADPSPDMHNFPLPDVSGAAASSASAQRMLRQTFSSNDAVESCPPVPLEVHSQSDTVAEIYTRTLTKADATAELSILAGDTIKAGSKESGGGDTLKASRATRPTDMLLHDIFGTDAGGFDIALVASAVTRASTEDDELPCEGGNTGGDTVSTIAALRQLQLSLPTVVLPDGQVHRPGDDLLPIGGLGITTDGHGNGSEAIVIDDDDEAMEVESRIATSIMLDEQYRTKARLLYEEDEQSGVDRDALCEYLGHRDPERAEILTAYLAMFNLRNMRLDIAMRRLCSHVFLVGEAQVIDRVIHAFAKRFWECNPGMALGSEDAVYGVAYSLLLLNTDRHNPQNSNRMSRSAFVKNTLTAINLSNLVSDSECGDENLSVGRHSTDRRSVHSNTSTSGKNQKKELVAMLKEMYASIKNEPLQMPRDVAERADSVAMESRDSVSSGSLQPGSRSSLNRSRSFLSLQGRMAQSAKLPGQRRRAPSSLAARSHHAPARRTSRLSLSALSQSSADASSIGGSDVESGIVPGISGSPSLRNIMAAYSAHVNLDDPSTTQIKTGILARKHLYERTDKKATNRSWRECLVVAERGEMKMFKKEKDSMGADGSELNDIQLQLGQLTLRHSLTTQLPPPGYSKRRPYVFAVQLPNGGVYLFQAASADLVREWVAVCNYWAARESKEPLGGGVGNVDYGWGIGRLDDVDEHAATPPSVDPDTPIPEWHVPQPPMVRSIHDESNQLRALLKQIQRLEDELVAHKDLHNAIARFPPKSSAYTRAFANWERKSQYLLRELIKYQTYADCLQQAVMARHRGSDEPDEQSHTRSRVSVTLRPRAATAHVLSQEELTVHRTTWTGAGEPEASFSPITSQQPLFFPRKHRHTPSGVTTSTFDTDDESTARGLLAADV